MAHLDITLREVGADQTRAYPSPIDQINRVLCEVAGDLSRWCWIRAYERAEAIYWPENSDR